MMIVMMMSVDYKRGARSQAFYFLPASLSLLLELHFCIFLESSVAKTLKDRDKMQI
jgi:hypothetical protein